MLYRLHDIGRNATTDMERSLLKSYCELPSAVDCRFRPPLLIDFDRYLLMLRKFG